MKTVQLFCFHFDFKCNCSFILRSLLYKCYLWKMTLFLLSMLCTFRFVLRFPRGKRGYFEDHDVCFNITTPFRYFTYDSLIHLDSI